MNIEMTIAQLLRNGWYAFALHHARSLPVSTEAERYRRDNYLICIITGSLKKDTEQDTQVASSAAYFLSEVEAKNKVRKRAYLNGPIALMRIKYHLF